MALPFALMQTGVIDLDNSENLLLLKKLAVKILGHIFQLSAFLSEFPVIEYYTTLLNIKINIKLKNLTRLVWVCFRANLPNLSLNCALDSCQHQNSQTHTNIATNGHKPTNDTHTRTIAHIGSHTWS